MIPARALPYLAVIACLVILVPCYVYFGSQLSGDADRYIARGTAVIGFLMGKGTHVNPDARTWLYLWTNLLSAAGDLLWGRRFAGISVMMNIGAFSIVVFLVYRVWTGGYAGRVGFTGAVLTLYTLVGLPAEVLKQLFFAMSSDVVAMLLEGIFLYCLIKAVLKGTTGSWIWTWVLAFLSVFARPAGVVLIVLTAAATLYLSISGRDSESRGDKAGLALLFVVPAALTFVAWPYLLQLDNVTWAQKLVGSLPFWITDAYSRGVVIKGDPATWINPPATYWGYLHIILDRLLYYVLPLRLGFSIPHAVLNIVYILFLTWAGSAGWRRLRRRRDAYSRLAPILLACSCYFALFYAVMVVDAFRYQLPFWLPLWILAGFGILRSAAHPADPGSFAGHQPDLRHPKPS